jgi:uncharacterized membrane protein YgcG
MIESRFESACVFASISILERLSKALQRVANTPAVKDKLSEMAIFLCRRRPEVVDVFVDQPSEVFRQRIFQPHAVLDLVVREDKPVVGVRRRAQQYPPPARPAMRSRSTLGSSFRGNARSCYSAASMRSMSGGSSTGSSSGAASTTGGLRLGATSSSSTCASFSRAASASRWRFHMLA